MIKFENILLQFENLKEVKKLKEYLRLYFKRKNVQANIVVKCYKIYFGKILLQYN